MAKQKKGHFHDFSYVEPSETATTEEKNISQYVDSEQESKQIILGYIDDSQ